jgi:hypothetical protein
MEIFMDQEAFNELLKKALKEKLTVEIKTEPDIYQQNPDMQTITVLFDSEPVAQFVLNPLY